MQRDSEGCGMGRKLLGDGDVEFGLETAIIMQKNKAQEHSGWRRSSYRLQIKAPEVASAVRVWYKHGLCSGSALPGVYMYQDHME